jgi:AcrR family transcriptional regulator
MSTTAEPGLRERKKVATRVALHEAAIHLALEHGPDKITVEAIADEAGVSRRTFSNYFGSKEEALMYGDLERFRTLIEFVHARPAGESAWTALSAAAGEFGRAVGEVDPEWLGRRRELRTHPTLIAAQVQTFAALERDLAAEIAARSDDPDPAGLRAQLMSASFLVALRVSLRVWLSRPPGTQLGDLVGETLAEAGRGFA